METFRLNRALRTLSAGNRMLLRASDETDLLQGMCRVIVEEGGYRSAAVGYARHDEQKSLPIMAYAISAQHPTVTDEYVRNVGLSWADSVFGRTVAGNAIRTGQPCVVRDVMTDPGSAPWRENSIRFGYGSTSAFPLRVDGEVLGMLVILAAERDAFDEREVALLGELADDLAYGIGNLRVRKRHEQSEAMIHRLAYYDALTGLPNRSLLADLLHSAIAAAQQQQRPMAILLMRLEHLKEINDTLGYQQGDTLLKAFAQRLQQAASSGETVARVGEAEFALLIPQADAEGAVIVAQRLSGSMRERASVGGLDVDLQTNTGIALFPGHGTDHDTLLRRARVAMFEASRLGRPYALFSQVLDLDCARRLTLLGELHRAIESDGLLLYCQPKLDLGASQIRGAEALLRWRHPVYGEISPSEFVKLAEQAGLMSPLTHWVLEAAFRQRYAWHQEGINQPLSVNLSALDLRDPKLIDTLTGLFATWGTQADWIQFELTESGLMDDPAAAVETLARLKQFGVRLYIDDFGIGYSSLAYLHKLPVDALKIDMSFVRSIAESAHSAAIVRSAVELGHSLALEVVAEGVESAAACERVMELGCDVAQGYYVSEPMPTEQFKAWLLDSPWAAAPAMAD